MAQPTREELISYLTNYMSSQANDPSWYYTTTPAELETLYKDLVKSQYDIKGDYSTVVNKYSLFDSNDPQIQKMFGFFKQIRDKQMTAADIINQQGDLLGPGQKQDLETYENEIYAIEKFEQETLADQRANAEIYGLPMPDDFSSYMPPIEMLKGLEPVQKGGMTELASSQRWQRDAQKKYAEAQAAFKDPKSLEQGPMVGEGRRLDPGYKKNWTSALWNDTLGRVLGEVDRDVAPAPVRKPSKEVTQARNTAYVAKRAADMRVQQDSTFTDRLAEEIARQMVAKYGTPYDAAIKKARELAEEEARKKATGGGGSSALSEWDKEQNRKRELFEGRGI